jgi:hypothetical protein
LIIHDRASILDRRQYAALATERAQLPATRA